MRFSADGALARFTRDLTADARAKRLDPVRCRASEIARVIDILLRQGKNNPVLVGPAGVGKTAIAEGLAQRIAAGDAPVALREVRILALDHVGLLAGTTYRGQYEERIRSLVDEVTAARDAILFIDELHNLIGQGIAMGAAMDAANMLKPALVRGDFRVIGATTDEEYARWIRGDPALERRFQRIEVRELGVDETLEILRARRERLERHHHVLIEDDALVAAVRLTDLFVTDRKRPDRAIDALDEACAHAHAIAGYSAETEALIRARVRGGPQPDVTVPRDAGENGTNGADDLEGDPFGQLARDGFAALERLGTELEAVFTGEPEAGTHSRPAPEAPPEAARPAAASSGRPDDSELARRLREEGIIVRGQDVARVISVATGRSVRWEE
ncbi:MAG TPA: AAA family ATPase [Gemmatimonadaceae bacterium]|nr:AAA family ATPase [Gemmatimonadaceae bacterium]